MTTKTHTLYVVTFQQEKDGEWKTAKLRATDKRRARTLARQRYGSHIRVYTIFPWKEFLKRKELGY